MSSPGQDPDRMVMTWHSSANNTKCTTADVCIRQRNVGELKGATVACHEDPAEADPSDIRLPDYY